MALIATRQLLSEEDFYAVDGVVLHAGAQIPQSPLQTTSKTQPLYAEM